MVEAAQESGYLQDLPDFIAEEDIGHLPRERVLMICTGSQGEPRSALARIARDEHPDVGLEPGDAGDLLLAHHPRQRACHRRAAQRAHPPRAWRS